MNKNEVCEKVMKILIKILKEKAEYPATFDEDISEMMDSVEFVMLIIEIEKEFNIKISDDDFDIENVNTVNKFADLVFKYKGNK